MPARTPLILGRPSLVPAQSRISRTRSPKAGCSKSPCRAPARVVVGVPQAATLLLQCNQSTWTVPRGRLALSHALTAPHTGTQTPASAAAPCYRHPRSSEPQLAGPAGSVVQAQSPAGCHKAFPRRSGGASSIPRSREANPHPVPRTPIQRARAARNPRVCGTAGRAGQRPPSGLPAPRGDRRARGVGRPQAHPSSWRTLTIGQTDPRHGLLRRREQQRRQHRVRQDGQRRPRHHGEPSRAGPGLRRVPRSRPGHSRPAGREGAQRRARRARHGAAPPPARHRPAPTRGAPGPPRAATGTGRRANRARAPSAEPALPPRRDPNRGERAGGAPPAAPGAVSFPRRAPLPPSSWPQPGGHGRPAHRQPPRRGRSRAALPAAARPGAAGGAGPCGERRCSRAPPCVCTVCAAPRVAAAGLRSARRSLLRPENDSIPGAVVPARPTVKACEQRCLPRQQPAVRDTVPPPHRSVPGGTGTAPAGCVRGTVEPYRRAASSPEPCGPMPEWGALAEAHADPRRTAALVQRLP